MRVVSQIALVVLLILGLVWFWHSPLREALRGHLQDERPTSESTDETPRERIQIFDEAPAPPPPDRPAEDIVNPRTRAGEPLVVELVEDPATHYSQPRMTEADRHYGRLAGRLDGLRYEPALGHAARELAGFHSQTDRLASGEVLSFLLDAAGAAEWTVEQLVTVTTQEGDEPIEAQLARARETWRRGEPSLRIGIGEAWTLARPARRHLIALVTRGRLELDRVPRTVSLGSSLDVSGRVPAAIPEVEILVMGPDLVVKEAAVTRRGDRFEAILPMGEVRGQTWIELIGDGPTGPKPMAQLSVFVGEELPWSFETTWPPD
ncbi:MAG: hypothetical protein QF464_18735, partial [Myxococcota bacterium]|nr:hypothetical protein [Myxococcota bacterium]